MEKRKKIVILATGGTIAGLSGSGIEAGYRSGELTVEALLEAVPQLTELAELEADQFSNIGSQDMTFPVLQALGIRINEVLAREDVHGVVVTHGTDSMEETAFFLNLTVQSEKPVVLTGAMRPATALSADGPLNLYNAVAVAAYRKSAGRGVMVVMNNKIHESHSMIKNNTTAVETFVSPVRGYLGSVNYGKAKFYRIPHRNHTEGSDFHDVLTMKLPRVDIHYGCDDMPTDLLDASRCLGAEGIVIAGVGNGNISEPILTKLIEIRKKGTVVVRASRVPAGTVGRNIEVDDDEYGLIASDELSPSKARILLMLALAKKTPVEEIQALFNRY